MNSSNRIDGRLYDQMRKFRLVPDFQTHPLASVLAECGKTKVICAVSCEPGVPAWMRAQGVSGGWLTCEYSLLPSSGNTRVQREAVHGKQSGRTMEIQRLIGRSLRSIINLEALGQHTLYVDCDVIDADGGTRCTAISGACCALQIAVRKLMKAKKISSNPIRENIGAVSVGMFGDDVLLDLCYEEDSNADVDMNVVMTESGKFSEVQGTAEGMPFDKNTLDSMLSLAQNGLQAIFKEQNRVLERYPIPFTGTLSDALSKLQL